MKILRCRAEGLGLEKVTHDGSGLGRVRQYGLGLEIGLVTEKMTGGQRDRKNDRGTMRQKKLIKQGEKGIEVHFFVSISLPLFFFWSKRDIDGKTD